MTEQDPAHQSITGDYNAQVSGSGSATVNVYQSVMPRAVDTDTLATAQVQRSTIPLDQVPPIAPLTSSSVMPFRANPAFVGRQDTLRQVAQHLRDTIMPGSALALTGMGGIGKTQLASEIVHRYGPFFAGGVFWLSCADPAILPGEIAACGARGLVDWRPDYLNLPQEEQIQFVLAAWQSPLPRLLVFDNCEDPDLLAQWCPTTGRCAVLVTSRRATWSPTMGITVYPLEVLQRSESITLLRQFRPDLAVHDPDLAALAEELGDLPLALHLAGSYLRLMQHAVTLTEYLDQIQAPELLIHPSLQGWELTKDVSPTRHEQDVARTFALSYRQLDAMTLRDQAARKAIAGVAAGAHGEVMLRAVLHAILDIDGTTHTLHARETVLKRLIDLGLLNQETNGGLRIHRLLAAFVQRETNSVDAVNLLTQALIKVAAQYDQQGVPLHIIELHPHLRQVALSLKHTDEMDVVKADQCNRIAYYCAMIGDYATARPLFERALAIYQQIRGANHPDTAMTLNNLAGLLNAQGDYSIARPLYERALAIYQQIRGANHPDTAMALNNLALLLEIQGDYNTARPLYERALAIREQGLGAYHTDTAQSLNNLAELHCSSAV